MVVLLKLGGVADVWRLNGIANLLDDGVYFNVLVKGIQGFP